MRTTHQIKVDIEAQFGFVPPFFTPAESTPLVLENLWHQTRFAYLDNPLPAQFKEKLFAYLSRYCSVPYCLVCHSCVLRPLGMQASEVLALLESPPPTADDVERHLTVLQAYPGPFTAWSSLKELEESLLVCAIFIALEQAQAETCRRVLHSLLGDSLYQELVMFIAYVKTCHTWTEAHPDLAYEADRRVQEHLACLLEAEPALAAFFGNYQERVRREQQQAVRQAQSAERQRAVVELRQSEEKFWQLAEQIRDLLWIASPTVDQLLYVNPAYETIWGQSREQLYANPGVWLERAIAADRDRLLARMESQKGYDEEYCIQRPDGSIRWIRERAFPIYDEAGAVDRLVGIAEDITDRKQVEQETQLLQLMTQAIVESEDFHSALQVALHKVCEATHWDLGEAWVPRADRTVLECSPAWYSKVEHLAAFRAQSQSFTFAPGVGLPGRVWRSKRPEWQRDVSALSGGVYLRASMALQAGLKAALGIPLIANDEVITVLVFYMFEARDEDERLIELISAATELGLFIQRKQTEGELRQSLAKEQELNQLKSNFIAMVSHEFRTPLATIVASAELLAHYGPRQSAAKRLSYFERIQTAARRMTQLLEAVLLIRQGEGGQLRFNPNWINLETVCRELIEELQANAGDRHTLRLVQQGEFTQVYLDASLLHHILTNLLSNAIKYSPQGGTILLALSRQPAEVIIQVQDFGIGIPLPDQRRLFEFFHRASNAATIPGTGLGLSIVKQCIEIHSGDISVESTVGAGTRFTVRLPSSDPALEPAPPTAAGDPAPSDAPKDEAEPDQ